MALSLRIAGFFAVDLETLTTAIVAAAAAQSYSSRESSLLIFRVDHLGRRELDNTTSALTLSSTGKFSISRVPIANVSRGLVVSRSSSAAAIAPVAASGRQGTDIGEKDSSVIGYLSLWYGYMG